MLFMKVHCGHLQWVPVTCAALVGAVAVDGKCAAVPAPAGAGDDELAATGGARGAKLHALHVTSAGPLVFIHLRHIQAPGSMLVNTGIFSTLVNSPEPCSVSPIAKILYSNEAPSTAIVTGSVFNSTYFRESSRTNNVVHRNSKK